MVIAEIDAESGERTESDILKEGGTALFIKTDVSNSLNVKNMVSRTVKEFRAFIFFMIMLLCSGMAKMAM